MITEKNKFRKSHTSTSSSNKLAGQLLDNSFTPDHFETNLDRMIQSLIKIKQKLISIQDKQLAEEIDWMIDTLCKNRLNDVVIKINKDNKLNRQELEGMLELLAVYSSELTFKREVETVQNAILEKTTSFKKVIDIQDFSNNSTKLYESLTKEEIFGLRDEIFSEHFNIFEFSNKVGRDSTMLVITGNIFNRFDLLQKIDLSIFINFILEIRNGYKKSNPYHNVKLLFLNIFFFYFRIYMVQM